MAVGLCSFPVMPPITGIELGTTCAGIKQTVKDDLLITAMAEGSTCAAVFTQNAFCAAPVTVAKSHLSQTPRWLLVNSGNANAGTGPQGIEDALTTCAGVAKAVGSVTEHVLPFSTGVIGQPLPVDKIIAAIPKAVTHLSEQNWQHAAKAIMTTDTFPKGATRTLQLDGHSITINGIAKGAGMIQPDMATMLAFIATDARIAQPLLQQCLNEAASQSFNLITVDGDTSTNDACVLMASGSTSAAEILPHTQHYELFAEAVLAVCKQLAELIIRDGEGATKLMRIVVMEALTDEEAVRVGKTIAHSPLVKTAFFASDPNWGRILAAVGRSDCPDLDIGKVCIWLGEVCIVENGGRASTYNEAAGRAVMSQQDIVIRVALGRGLCVQQVLTCDFSYDYVRINADYRS